MTRNQQAGQPHYEIHCPYCSNLVMVRPINLGNLLQCPNCPGKFRVPSDLAQTSTSVRASASGQASQPNHPSGSAGQSSFGGYSGVQPTGGGSGRPMPNSPRPPAAAPQHPQYFPQQPMSRPAVSSLPSSMRPAPAYAGGHVATSTPSNSQNAMLMMMGLMIAICLVLLGAVIFILANQQNLASNTDRNEPSSNVAQQRLETPPPAEKKLASQADDSDSELSFHWDKLKGVVEQKDRDDVEAPEGFRADDYYNSLPSGQTPNRSKDRSSTDGSTRSTRQPVSAGTSSTNLVPTVSHPSNVTRKREPHRYTAHQSVDDQ